MSHKHSGIGMTSQRTRERLIARLREQGIREEQVLDAIRKIPRHLFVDEALASRAYEDTSLPIGHGQTISQPLTVARMTECLFQTELPAKVLEVGTGSGYQTAVLASLFPRIFTVERIEALWWTARKRLVELGMRNIEHKLSDGSWGWPEHGPYDAIIVTAAASEIPRTLAEQLAPDGRMVLPVGCEQQDLLLVTRSGEEFVCQRLGDANFVPLVKDRV